MTRCSTASPGSAAATRRSGLPIRIGCSICGGQRSGSSTRVGGYLNVVVHPFVSGRALRIEMMDRLITRMKTLPGVWFATCEDVARHCLAHYPVKEAV